MTAPLDDRVRDLADRLDDADPEELSDSEKEDIRDEWRDVLDALQPLADFWASVPDETKQRLRERVDMRLEQGHYDAELRTPDGGVFKVCSRSVPPTSGGTPSTRNGTSTSRSSASPSTCGIAASVTVC